MALSAAPALSARSCSFRIIPTPRSISDTRAVMRLLQRFGDLNTYKNFKNEPKLGGRNSGMVIFRDAATAKDVMDRSPMYGWLVDEGRRTDTWGQLDVVKALGPGVKAVLENDEEARNISDGAVLEEGQQLNEIVQETESEAVQADAARYASAGDHASDSQHHNLDSPWSDEAFTDAKDSTSSENLDADLTFAQGPIEANSIGSMMIAGEDELTATAQKVNTKTQKHKGTSQQSSNRYGHRQTRTMTTTSTHSPSQPPTLPRQFKLVLEPWRGNHADYIERTRFYNKFEPNVVDPMHGDLIKKVPLKGLSDVAIYAGRGILNYQLERLQREVAGMPGFERWMRDAEKKREEDREMEGKRGGGAGGGKKKMRLSMFGKG